MNLKELLSFALNFKASDLHLREGLPPIIRVNGKLLKTNLACLEHQDLSQLIYPLLNPKQRQSFETGLVLRLIPNKILSFEELGLPAILKELSLASNGLILVTGPTGSGKSTTLAAMLDFINKTCQKHILTTEDPIEFLHSSESS